MTLSTQQHAETIAESYINGQHKQAVEQFAEALNEYCNPTALALAIADTSHSHTIAIHVLGRYIAQQREGV